MSALDDAEIAALRALLAEQLGAPERLVHINAGSVSILREILAADGP